MLAYFQGFLEHFLNQKILRCLQCIQIILDRHDYFGRMGLGLMMDHILANGYIYNMCSEGVTYLY